MFDAHGAQTAYVVRRDRDELRGVGASLYVQPGMLALKRSNGPQHPLIHAVARAGTITGVVDATLGLANDALHIADILGVDVLGIEGSATVFSLLEEGLPRLAKTLPAAGRITAHWGEASATLAQMSPSSTDVVVLDPMFDTPRPAAPGFALLRTAAYPGVDSTRLLDAARRVARSHVVVKYPKRATAPSCDECIDGKAVRYLIYGATSCWPRPTDRDCR